MILHALYNKNIKCTMYIYVYFTGCNVKFLVSICILIRNLWPLIQSKQSLDI